MVTFLFDNELLLSDLAKKIGIDKSTISRAKDRGTIKPAFLIHLRKFKFKFPPDIYISGEKK
jgi:DNA-directed RNA polymerase specialized sigma54-like protein